MVATAEHARRALELTGPDDHLARGAGAGLLGLAAWAQGDVRTALQTFTDAVASLHAAGNLSDELGGTVVLADMWLAAGYPGTARRLYTRALQRAEALAEDSDGETGHSVPRGTADLHVGLGELDHETGDLDGARRHLETAAGLDERAGISENRHRWFVAMARISDAAGDTNGALRHLDHAEQRYMPGFYPNVRPIAAPAPAFRSQTANSPKPLPGPAKVTCPPRTRSATSANSSTSPSCGSACPAPRT